MTTGKITALAVGISLVASSPAFGTMSRMPRTEGCPNIVSFNVVGGGSCPDGSDDQGLCQTKVDEFYGRGKCTVSSSGNSCSNTEDGYYLTCALDS